MKDFALYKGDELECIGTVNELAKHRGVKPSTIRFYASSVYKRRTANSKTGNVTSVVRLDGEEE